MSAVSASGPAPIRAGADGTASADLRIIDGRRVVWFRIAGGKHHGAIGEAGGATVERAVQLAGQLQVPLVGELDTSGAELGEGVAALHAWGRLAHELVGVSGVVPTLLAVTGACVSGPALALGCFDQVVMTDDAFAFVTGPESVGDFTGEWVSRAELGGSGVHDRRTGVAALVVRDEVIARDALVALLSYLPDHHLADPQRWERIDDRSRPCTIAARTIPERPNASYDVRTVIDDLVDAGSRLELRAGYAENLVTALAALDGRPIGIVANQPMHRAGTIDIEASRKAARFIAWCDSFNLPILTLVDTPGFEPGRDLEWRGMIRHGAELVHAYAAASVPRLCVVMRKAYGGAYIVMDSRGIGNDLTVAWPTARIAVMGGAPAVQILHGKRLRDHGPEARAAAEGDLVDAYEAEFDNPYRAAERGLVDAVIAPDQTRAVLCDALEVLATKRDRQPARRHSNTPL
ncbi:MAG: acyl-CoA carboxylase subunit beta [Acidimicrobiia bacterium]